MVFVVDVKELRKIMIDKGINTIGELAELSGVDRNTLSLILRELALPSANVIAKLVEALDIPAERVGAIFFVRKLTKNVSYNE